MAKRTYNSPQVLEYAARKDGLLSETKLNDDALEHIINLADKALYDVKQSGRNSVQVASEVL